ncbi:MAG: hypothetical protein R3281_02810 [Balneolaceae bacterium]|nr:hypothetical protein [Balneolaceae bacterium]
MELTVTYAVLLFAAGLLLVLFFSEKLVESTVGTSLNFGISAFLVSVIFIGFDPENLAVGAVASVEKMNGIATGTIFGSAMVAIALALGITALIVPLRFDEVPGSILAIPVISTALLGVLCLDGELGRVDGILLLAAYAGAVGFLLYLSGNGADVRPSGELRKSLEEAEQMSGWQSAGWLLVSLAAIYAGSEMLLTGTGFLIGYWQLSETVTGMTVLALVISMEELARELPAALKGRPEIAYGNVVGSILAFFLFNAGCIALLGPVTVDQSVTTFYLPICIGTVLFLAAVMSKNTIPRWAGALLFAIYLLFFIRGFYG